MKSACADVESSPLGRRVAYTVQIGRDHPASLFWANRTASTPGKRHAGLKQSGLELTEAANDCSHAG